MKSLTKSNKSKKVPLDSTIAGANQRLKERFVMTPTAPDEIGLFARGQLVLSATQKCRASFHMRSEEELFPGLVEVRAPRQFLEVIAFGRSSVQIEICDMQIRCQVAGYRKNTGVLLLLGASFFGGIERALTARSRRPVLRTRRRDVRAA